MKKISFQVIGGLFSILIFCLLAYLTVVKKKSEGLLLRKGITISLPNVEGLKFGNTVFIQGIPFGDVDRIRIKEDRILVNIIFQKEVQFYRDYLIVLKNFSVFGKKAIYINPGREKYGPVIPGTLLKGKTIEDPFDYAATVLKENKENLKIFLKNLAQITKKIDRSKSTLSLLLNDPLIYDKTVFSLKEAKKLIKSLEKAYQKYRTDAGANALKDAIYQFDR